MTGPVTIRQETTADHDAIAAVVGAAFRSSTEVVLVERIRDSAQYRPALALVAEVEDVVVGHVMISGATLVTLRDDRPIVMLSPLAVRPAHQRQGIGGMLVRTSCELARQAGEPFVVLEGSPRYYSRFGFESSHRFGIELPLPDWAPRDAGQILRFEGWDPSWRGTVAYPAAFDGLE